MSFGLAVKKFVDRQPIVSMAIVIGGIGVMLPIVVPPIRESMGLPTNQVCFPL
ncbi:unnamed protein product, partial [Discosporangium mesarthrocarpum]